MNGAWRTDEEVKYPADVKCSPAANVKFCGKAAFIGGGSEFFAVNQKEEVIQWMTSSFWSG